MYQHNFKKMNFTSIPQLWQSYKNTYQGLSLEMWLLVAANLMNRFGAMVIAFFPIYLPDNEHFTIQQSGFVMTSYGVGSVFGNFLGGKLSDKFGFRETMIISLILSSVVLISIGYVHGFWPLMIASFIMSFTADIFRPANSSAAIEYSDAETRTRSFSLLRMAFNLGWTVCPALGGILVYYYGWIITFWVDGLTCLAAALMLFLLKPKSKKKEIETPIENVAKESTGKSAYQDNKFLIFIFLTFINAFVFMQIIWTLPYYFKELLHFNEFQVGLLMALNGLIVFTVEMPLIYKIEKKRSPIDWICIGLLFYVASFWVLLAPIGALIVSVLCVVGLSIGEIFVMPFSSNYVTSISNPKRQGEYMALYSISYAAASILAPLVGTQIIGNFGYPVLWLGVGMLAIVDLIGMKIWVKD
jgi:predicted MFS family arabinose efflux permease